MFYKFNSLAGRVVSSGQAQAYLPQGLKAATPKPEIIYASGTKFTKVTNYTKRAASGSGEHGAGYGEVCPRIVKLQQKFQVDDGVPVHLKGGPHDKIIYGFTLLLCAIGLEECGRLYYELAFPPKIE